jgi:hypothetical protein
MTAAVREPRSHWTDVSADTGWHNTSANRAVITTAAERITWTDQPATVRQLHRGMTRVLVAAVFFGRLNQLREAGTIDVAIEGHATTLVGLADEHNRYYLLDLGDEAVYVLHESWSA